MIQLSFLKLNHWKLKTESLTLGFDRLVMLACQVTSLDGVLPFPIERAWFSFQWFSFQWFSEAVSFFETESLKTENWTTIAWPKVSTSCRIIYLSGLGSSAAIQTVWSWTVTVILDRSTKCHFFGIDNTVEVYTLSRSETQKLSQNEKRSRIETEKWWISGQ